MVYVKHMAKKKIKTTIEQKEPGESKFDYWGKVVPASIGRMLPTSSCVPILISQGLCL